MDMISNHSSFNNSFRNTTATAQPKLWLISMSENSKILLIFCYSILLLLTVFGNILVIFIVYKNRRMWTTINFLIVNMALSDLIGSLFTITRLISVFASLSLEWGVPGIFGNVLCKLCPFIRDVSITISIESMVVIAFDRFFAVIFPMKSIPRVMRLRFILTVIWLLAAAPFSLNFATYKLAYYKEKMLCQFYWPSYFQRAKIHHVYFISAIVILFFILPLIVVTVLYTIIIWKIKRSVIPGQQLSAQETKRQKVNNSVIKMALVIVFSFFICWFPYHTLSFFQFFVWKEQVHDRAPPHFYGMMRNALTFISYVSFAINPFICFVFSSNYRNHMKKLFPLSLYFENKFGVFKVKMQRTSATQVQEMTIFNNAGFSEQM